MSAALLRWTWIGLAAVLAHGCVVGGADVGFDAGPSPYYGFDDYGLDYYEPPDVFYGGWGEGFDVAPYRAGREYHPGFRGEDFRGQGFRGEGFRGGGPGPRAFRGAPAGRAIPSLPGRGGGGFHGGGGARGGGGGARGGGGGRR
jgi:hypothetical protein